MQSCPSSPLTVPGPSPPPLLPSLQVLMTNAELSIPAPLFVTWFQCLFTVGLCYLCGELGELQRKKVKGEKAKRKRTLATSCQMGWTRWIGPSIDRSNDVSIDTSSAAQAGP
jgi:hypothetical protein